MAERNRHPEHSDPRTTPATRPPSGAPGGMLDGAAASLGRSVLQRKLIQRRARSNGSGASGVIQRKVDETTAPAGTLTAAKVQSAVSFNRKRGFKAESWAKVAAVVNSTKSTLGDELVKAIATWQAAKGLTADGMCGDVTVEWMSHEPGGDGLGDLIKKETTLYMGLNPEAKGVEYNQLKGQIGGDLVGALGSGDRHQDQVSVGGQWVDLTGDAGLQKALSSLPGLPEPKAKQIVAFVQSAQKNTLDEMFQMIQHLWGVERGKTLLKRLVLSGHSNGGTLWGGHSGEYGMMPYQQLYDLMSLFPRAAGQVEDLAFSACFSGLQENIEQYKQVFPNLKTIWGYADYSPSAATGSLRHLSNWEKGTKGHGDEGANQAREKVAKGTGPRDQNVAIWSASDGYQTNVGRTQMSAAELVTEVDSRQSAFDTAYKDGVIDKTALDDLQPYLQTLVRMHGAELGEQRQRYSDMNLRTLYLRHWSTITEGFLSKHGTDVKAGYDEAGATMPKLGSMERKPVLDEISAFAGKVKGAKGQKAKKLLEQILRDLDPAQVPYGAGTVA